MNILLTYIYNHIYQSTTASTIILTQMILLNNYLPYLNLCLLAIMIPDIQIVLWWYCTFGGYTAAVGQAVAVGC